MESNENKTNYYNEYIEADRKARRLDQEAEKQQLFTQKVQQQNTTLTSQLELYKERVRVLENIKGDNNYLNEFLEADRQAKHFNQQAQSQFIRDQDIIRDLKQQRDKLDLAVIDYKRQKEEYQKTQTIFNQTQRDKEEKYLNDIIQLQAKNKDLENVVCKMGKSTETLRLLTNEQKAFRDNLRKSGLGYNGPYVLSQAYAKIPKLYRAYELCNKNEQLHVFDSEETLEDAEKSQLKMNEFQKDEKVQELKIKPIDYTKLNKLYDDFVPQKELSAEQTYFPSSFISSENVSSETKPSMASMPSANPMLVDLNEMENVFKKLFELLEKNCKRESIFYTSKEELRLIDVCVEAKLILREWHVYFEVFQNRFKRDVKEMKDVFVSVENDLDETFKQNELLKDQLLEASLAEDIKNLVITSCVEIRNKDLHDETERISKESKDVSNESKTADTVCNDAFEVTQELSKRIVELEKDLSKFEAKSIAFEIALQHKSRENNSLKTLQKENENFMASLQIENAHLKQTYKDLFDSVQRSRVETNHCDEVKVKVNFDEIETKNIELEYQVASLIKENEHLKLTYQSLFDSIKKSRVQTKTSNVTQNEAENLKSQLFEFAETKFNNIFGKIEFFKKKQLDISELNKESGEKQNLFENETSVFQIKIDELEKSLAKQIKENSDLLIKIDNLENVFADEEKRATLGKLNAFDNENCDFESKVIHLEKIIAQKSKDFDDVNLELSNRTAKFEAYFEKLEKTKVVLERQLARKVDDSKAEKDRFLKEINHLRTQLENLKGKRVETKFDNSLILGKPPLLNNERDQLLKQIASLESKLASQDIRSCQKEYHELRTSYNALKVKFDSLNRKKWNINVSKSSKPKESVSEKVHTGESSKPFLRRVSQFTTYSLQKDRKFSKKSQSFETFSPQKGFKTRASNAKNHVFVTPHSRFTPVKQVWRPKQSHLKTFKYSKSEMLSMQNKNDLALKIKYNGRFSNASNTNFQNVSSNDNNKWKSSSSTRFKTPHETPSFKNQWKIKRNFKSPLILRELFSNETPVSSSRWNSTSLHRIDTTLKWFSKLGKPVSTVLKWVPKVVV
ncbi:hypothetical protein Tco_1371097 [Tanacetum coccineum]